MGSTHSDTHSSDASTRVSYADLTPSQVGCCPSPRPQWSQLLAQLQRKLARKRQCAFQRGCGARTALLRPMPRCSSFGSCSTLLTPSRQQQQQQQQKKKRKQQQVDNNYAQWKCMFEHAESKRLLPQALRPHDISEALSGQTTPRGFPSHTDTRRCTLAEHPKLLEEDQAVEQEQELEQHTPLYDDCKVRRRLSFRLPGSGSQSSVRRLSTRQKADQAKLEQQLERELRDLEEYYGAFHYARRNERRI
ncbi:hypothetical protein AWZ03_012526 [Drosophila navojoa]|uniref:Protein nullo n=1 Tax=Drosophila navojoa TaxID=7232 RepID=A0A484AWR7_DRONA|nr:protein nullo [Drosophila navojoa]TDG41049.1 hypothetical protein AWZ03_012526 [Drosophila navojoa]